MNHTSNPMVKDGPTITLSRGCSSLDGSIKLFTGPCIMPDSDFYKMEFICQQVLPLTILLTNTSESITCCTTMNGTNDCSFYSDEDIYSYLVGKKQYCKKNYYPKISNKTIEAHKKRIKLYEKDAKELRNNLSKKQHKKNRFRKHIPRYNKRGR